MDKIMEKLNKLSLPATILIASLILGGFYFASENSKQKSIERQQQIKIEQEIQEQLAKELKEQETKEEAELALNTCISTAESNYSEMWHRECKALGKLTSKCIDIVELDFNDYLDKYGLNPTTYNQERGLVNTGKLADDFFTASIDYFSRRGEECSCRLLVSTADRFNESLEKNKVECFRRYPQ
jgi:hypothetical protein